MIYDILDSSQIKEKKIKPIISEFPLTKPIEDVKSLMSIQTNLKNIELKINNNFDENFLIKSDERRLKQVLINLLGNSIKFTSKGFIELKTYLDEDCIIFEVQDTGTGIAAEIIPKLTEPFATFDNEKGMNKQGIGLGLNNCKNIIGILGPEEKITITSELEKGSLFSFKIYQNINKDEDLEINLNFSNISENSLNISDVSEFPSYRFPPLNPIFYDKINNAFNILIVDDNIFNIVVLETILKNIEKLEKKTFKILKAYNGKEALELFIKNNKNYCEDNINLIIMDIEMPILDGIECTKKIKEIIDLEEYVNAEIIAYSALLTKENKNYYKKIGFNSSLEKPAEQAKLQQFLKRVYAVKIKSLKKIEISSKREKDNDYNLLE